MKTSKPKPQRPRKPVAKRAVRGWSREKIAELKGIIEGLGGDPDGFWQLRSDTYEHTLARRSLDELERFYSVLFTPGKNFEEIRKDCPPWPRGTRYAGRLPTDSVLSDIRARFAQEKTINDVGFVRNFLIKFKDKAASQDLTELLDSVCRMLGHEVVSAKMAGMPVNEQLRAVDRLLKRETQRITWAKVKAWLDDETAKAISNLVEECKGDARAIELLKKVESRIRELHASAESRAA
mgnify:FL=1